MQRPVIVALEADWVFTAGVHSLFRARGCDVATARGLDVERPRGVAHAAAIVVALDGRCAARGIDLICRLTQACPSVPLIAAVRNGTEELAIGAFRAGIRDYLREPVQADTLVECVMRSLGSPGADASRTFSSEVGGHRLIGASAAVAALRARIQRVAATHANVLLTGETGTGKELVAELIHANSPRRDKPFVSINCAAIPEGLLESELFGFEKGAFTGAQSHYAGKLQLADDGTTLFDEIGDMSLAAQAKILRAIETREIYRLGGTRRNAIDIRMIAATNQDLERLVEEGRFRKDLFFRLNVVRIHLPALRERREDIPLLLDHFVRGSNHQFRRDVEGFSPTALDRLVRYDWPGNVRELRNLVEGLFVNLPPHAVRWLDLPEQLACAAQAATGDGERDRLLSALLETNWNKSRAAEKLSWSRMTVYRKMAKYHVTRDVCVLAGAIES